MNRRDDLSPGDLRILKEAYESQQPIGEIADRFSFSPDALKSFCSRRGWKRPKELYRCGVDRKEIPEARRETAKLLWESGENCSRIGRWIGVSENTAQALCRREFGYRNLRLNRQTYFMRRNLQMAAMAASGVPIDEIADQFWLGPKSVRELVGRVKRKHGHVPAAASSPPLLERYEVIVRSAVAAVVEAKMVPGQFILWPTRGKAPVAAARGLGMYLVHVEASYSLTDTGLMFGRDRTTVSHACALVEDARDDASTDSLVEKTASSFLSAIGQVPSLPALERR